MTGVQTCALPIYGAHHLFAAGSKGLIVHGEDVVDHSLVVRPCHVWLGVEENDIETLKGLPEFERVGGYYLLGEELSEQGYHASYVYCDAQMMEIAKAQMNLLEGRVPEKANEVVVSKYFLSTYGNNAKIGDTEIGKAHV